MSAEHYTTISIHGNSPWHAASQWIEQKVEGVYIVIRGHFWTSNKERSNSEELVNYFTVNFPCVF